MPVVTFLVFKQGNVNVTCNYHVNKRKSPLLDHWDDFTQETRIWSQPVGENFFNLNQRKTANQEFESSQTKEMNVQNIFDLDQLLVIFSLQLNVTEEGNYDSKGLSSAINELVEINCHSYGLRFRETGFKSTLYPVYYFRCC